MILEPGEEAATFLSEYVAGWTEGGQLAFAENGDFRTCGQSIGGVVGDEDGLDFVLGEPGLQLAEDLIAGGGIEGGERLVEQEQAGHGRE